MKRFILLSFLCLLIAGISFAQARGTMYAAVKDLELRSSSGHFASVKGKLEYGEAVTVIRADGNWLEVRSNTNSALSGWTAASNLTSRRLVAGSTATTTAREVALAGKGFNREVENSYKTDTKLNYTEVDNAEAIQVSDADLQKFITEGNLRAGR